MRKRVGGALALLWLVLIVGVAPYLLLRIGSLGGLARALNPGQPDDGTLLVSLLTVAAWLAWGVVVATIVLEALSQLTLGRISIRLPGTGWLGR